ncbi:uncharacterized protein TNCV_3842341 [Trichonephila clavipes]|nr:uncharacterized protein TNCV_3842341 [Trichonephila clavipes]
MPAIIRYLDPWATAARKQNEKYKQCHRLPTPVLALCLQEFSGRLSDTFIHVALVAHPVYWLATLTAVPLGLGSNPGEDMDVCKCIVPSRHGGTLNSRRAASPLVRLVEREERRGKIADISLIAGKEFRNWVVKDLDPLSQAVPTVKKRRRNIVLSFSHDSVTTARLKSYNVHLDIGPQRARYQGSRDRQGRQNNKRSRKDD